MCFMLIKGVYDMQLTNRKNYCSSPHSSFLTNSNKRRNLVEEQENAQFYSMQSNNKGLDKR